MMTLITGMPGNGKTLYAVNMIREALKKGRRVVTDIEGLTLEGVNVIPRPSKDALDPAVLSRARNKGVALPPPEHDWRSEPEGTLVVYDEAHKRFPAFSGKGRSPLPWVQEMDEHRHKGVDMAFVTQWPDKMDRELIHLCGEHYHLHRAFGLQQATVWKFSKAQMNPYSATSRKGADEEIWSYPKELYKVYASSSMHTDAHKFKLPKKIKGALAALPFTIAALWGFYAFITPDTPEKPTTEERSEAEPTKATALPAAFTEITAQEAGDKDAPPAAVAQVERRAFVGCIASADRCRCFDAEGYKAELSQAECRSQLKRLDVNLLAMREERRMGAGHSPARPAGPSMAAPAAALAPTGVGTEGFAGQQARYGQMRREPIPADPAFSGG